MIGNVPLVLEGCLRVCFRGLSFQSYRFFVPRKIVLGFGFMGCLPVIGNVSLDLGSRLRVYFHRICPPICIGSLFLEISFSCLVSWVVFPLLVTVFVLGSRLRV
jgi:hypothetical protein